MRERLSSEYIVRFRRCGFEINDSRRVNATIMETNCVQVRHSVRTNRTVSCLGANMKEYAACERRMHHSLGPRLCEHLFEVVNALLTVPRAVGNLAASSPILLQLETMEEVQRELLNSPEGFSQQWYWCMRGLASVVSDQILHSRPHRTYQRDIGSK